MKLGLAFSRSNPQSSDQGKAPDHNADRCLSLLVEGAAAGVPEVDATAYKEFQANMTILARRLPDRLPEEEKLALIKSILQEFENYREDSQRTIRERVASWRGLATMLVRGMFESMGLKSDSEEAAKLILRIGSLLKSEEIHAFRLQLADFLRVGSDGAVKPSSLKQADHSTANDNAAGLRGGGAAVEHIKRLMEKNASGFVVFFRLGSLDLISQRYGREVVEDCLMAVSAYLTASLRSDDVVYHWSDSSLLAILQSPYSEKVLSAAMRRVIDNNRDIAIQINERSVMLRIPLEFELVPISRLRTPEDIFRIAAPTKSIW